MPRGATVPIVQTRRLGRTEHRSSVAILGAAAFWDSTPESTEAAFHLALDAGVNHLDIAPQYGRAQELVGPFVPAVRDRLFVACKTIRKNADGVKAQLDESLGLLGCDSFDLYQLHGVTDLADLDGRAAAAETILGAKAEGLCRYVGITGHGLDAPTAHRVALERYDFDTVMFPVNPRLWADPQYREDAEALLEEAARRDVGVMAIKAGAARPWKPGERHSTTWYEPYTAVPELRRGIEFALSTPGVAAFCTPGDVSVLTSALGIAGSLNAMDEAARSQAMDETIEEPLIFPMPA
jgi:aryl-alcohol dehydrogenase-like predicted oxidoreductase